MGIARDNFTTAGLDGTQPMPTEMPILSIVVAYALLVGLVVLAQSHLEDLIDHTRAAAHQRMADAIPHEECIDGIRLTVEWASSP